MKYDTVIVVEDTRTKPPTWAVMGKGDYDPHMRYQHWHPIWKGLTETEANIRAANYSVLHPVGDIDPYDLIPFNEEAE